MTHSVFDRLSPVEQRIAALLPAGTPNKTIAKHLAMAEATVKVHMKSMLLKTSAANRTALAVMVDRELRDVATI